MPRSSISPAFLVAALSLGFLPVAASAQQSAAATAEAANSVSVHLDPARTTVAFSAGSLHRVHGSFLLKGGIFAIDTHTGVADGEILVDAESEKSNDSGLDRKIRTQTLETEKYPTILFHPEKVSGTLPAHDGEAHLKLAGSFTIHGQDHPLTVDVLAQRSGSQLDLSTQFTVPYVTWGMKDASTFFMRDRNIRITVTSHGILEGSEDAAGTKS